MKQLTIMATAIILLAACNKESTFENTNQSNPLSNTNSEMKSKGRKVTRPIFNSLESDPDPSLPPLPCGAGGGAIFHGFMTHLGRVHGQTVNKTCSLTPEGKLAITSDDISYAANGDELYTRGNIVVTFPTDGSTTATITGGSTIVGGTGRFEGATGYFIYEHMVLDLTTGHESHRSHGIITY